MEPRHLFADVRSLRDAHHLLRQRRLIDRQRHGDLPRALEQPRFELLRGRYRPRRQCARSGRDSRPLRASRSAAQVLAFADAHLFELIDGAHHRLVHDRAQHAPTAAGLGQPLANAQRLRQAQQIAGRQLALDQPALARQLRWPPPAPARTLRCSSTSGAGAWRSCSDTRPRRGRAPAASAPAPAPAARDRPIAGGSRSCKSRNRWLTARIVTPSVPRSSSRVSEAKPVMLLIIASFRPSACGGCEAA